MIEKIIYDYLKEKLSCLVVLEIPPKPPDTFVRIEKTGGHTINHISYATVAIQSYGSSLYNASALNETVKAEMEDIITLHNVSSCELNSNYNYTDTTEKRYRYQAVFDVVFFERS